MPKPREIRCPKCGTKHALQYDSYIEEREGEGEARHYGVLVSVYKCGKCGETFDVPGVLTKS